MTKFQGRHGDMLFEAVAALPPGAKRVAVTREYVAALGEATGHTHTIIAPTPMEVWEDEDGTRYLLTGMGVIVTHEEHGTKPLSAGILAIIPQQETDLRGQWRKVVD